MLQSMFAKRYKQIEVIKRYGCIISRHHFQSNNVESLKEIVVKRFALALTLCMAVPFALFAQNQAAPEIPFDSVPNFLKLPPNIYLGETAGVAVNSKGHVFVFTRGNSTGPAYGASAAQLLEFGPDGTYLREIGHNLYAWSYSHAVKVDKEDNIWVTDKGSDMVIKFNPAGQVVMVFGRKQEASDESTGPLKHVHPPLPPVDGQFRQVTDVTWDPAGNTYISDGYINSRVAKVDKNGNWLKSFGEPGAQPGQLNTPHSIAADAKGNIYVADRGNRRIQVFDSDLNLVKTYDNVGAPWAVCISPGPHQYLYSSNSNPDNNDSRQMAVSGEIYKMELDGTVVGKFGKPGKQAGEFSTVHAMDCRNENELVVAEITAWRVQKIILKPRHV